MILVAGGTGTLGRAVAERLLEQTRPVRILTRSPARAGDLQNRGAEITPGDLRDPRSLQAACRGATRVITTANAFMGRGSESVAAVDRRGNRNLIDAARHAGVRQFIFTSALLKDEYKRVDYFAAKCETEDYLRGSGLPYTILHPTAFMDTWALVVGDPLMKTGSTNVFGPGTVPINLVAVDNVADVAVLTIDNPAALNATVEIGGPENLTLNQVVGIFERVRGLPGRRRHLPVPLLRALGVIFRPFNPVLARQMTLGALAGSVPQPFDPSAMLARYPIRLTTLEEWVRAHYEVSQPHG